MIEVFADVPLLDGLWKVFVGGTDEAHVHFDFLGRAYGTDAFLLDGTKQLKNTVKRATLLAQDSFITPVELALETTEQASGSSIALHDEADEKRRILNALQQTGNNKSKAATLLGIDRKTLYNKLKLHNIPT